MKSVHLSSAARIECKPSKKRGRYELALTVKKGTHDDALLEEMFQTRASFQFMPAAVFEPVTLESVNIGTESITYHSETDVDPMLA
jgi:hypothetical protein